MQEHLGAIHESLMWEFGPAVRGEGHRLVITPEGNHHLRPLVNAVLSRAPEVKGWEFYGYRLPESVEMAEQTVQARTGGEIAGAKAQAEAGAAGKVDLIFCLPGCTQPDEEEQLYHAFVAAETLLGEETLNAWIGGINVEPLPKGGLFAKFRKPIRRADVTQLLPLDQLRSTVQSLIARHVAQLPAAPCWQTIQDAKWAVCELQAEPADEYAGRDDLIFAATTRPDLLEAWDRGLFHSVQLSRCGETFCYFKLDRSAAADPEKYLDREPLENAINQRLIPAKLGCVIGGGTGVRYSYIDLALTDLQRGVAAVREALRSANVPLRSWIQFFDADLSTEWVGIHSEAPPPP
jgi:hypothetical protein